MSEKPFKITVEGPGISIAREVAESVLPRLMALLVIPDSAGVAEPHIGRQGGSVSATSIGEFLSELNIRSNPERIAGVALFLRETMGRDTVSKDDLPTWFQRAGQPAPKNIHRDIKDAVAQRLIAEDHAHAGEFLVTDTGVRVLRGAGDAVTVRASRRASGARRSAVRSKSSDKKAAANGDGPTAKVQELIEEGWFESPRTLASLIYELAARGAHYKAPDLTYQMQQFVKAKQLRRKKELPAGGKREVWHYSNW
jgi:hypothetical protein